MKPVLEFGNWLKQYGECIYKTHGGPYHNYRYIWATCKENNVYIIINNITYKSNILTLPKLPANVQNVTLLTNGNVDFEENNSTYKFTTNNIANDDYTVIKMTFDKKAISFFPINGGNK
jgi:hypothetical protein